MTTIDDYVNEIQAADNAHYREHYPNLPLPIYTVSTGGKFFKIICKSGASTSVHCFVEIATGDIYKAATWNRPANGVRGNINNEKKPLLGYDFYRRNYYL
jgi:hypothetical protein